MAAPVVSSNVPSAGFISWTATRIVFAGNSYPIPAGNTNKRFTYWRLAGSTPGVYTQSTDTLAGGTSNVISTDTLPDSTQFDGLTDTMLFLNKSGIAVLAPSATTVDGSLIVSGSILTDAIGANQITTAKLDALAVTTANLAADAVTAAKIKAGEINTNHLSSGVVTASKLSIGAYTDNLAPNPYFEDWPIANAMPERWNLSTATGYTGATVTRETSGTTVIAGGVTLGLTAGVGLQAAIYSDTQPVVTGRDIYLGVYFAGTGAALAGGMLAGLYFYNSAGTLIATQSTPMDIAGGSQLQQVQHVGVAPPGAVTMQPLIITSSNTKVLIDNVEMAYRTQSVMIQDGAITADKINSKAVTADKLEATMVLANKMTTRTLDGNGDPSGAGLDILSGPQGGLYTFDATGAARVELPTDPALADTFRGNAEIDTLTVNLGATLPATQLSQNSTFSMQTAVQASGQPPTALVSYNTTKFNDDGLWGTRAGATFDGTNWFTFRTTTNGGWVEKWNSSGVAVSALKINYIPYGMAWDGSSLKILCWNTFSNIWDLLVLQNNLLFVADILMTGTAAQLPETKTSNNAPNLCYDFTAGQFIIVQGRISNGGKLRQQRFTYNNTNNTMSWGATAIDTTFAYQNNIGFCLYGSFDLGSPHLLYGTFGTSAVQAVDATGAQDNQFSWAHGSSAGRKGMVWTGTTTPFTTGQFQMFDATGIRYNYETAAGNRWTASGDATWYAAYSWTNGAAETPLSKIATFTMSKRAQVKFTLAALPTGATGAKLYLAKGTAPSQTTVSMKSQTSTPTGTPLTLTVTSALFPPTADNKIVSTFGSATPAKITSQNGTSIVLSGDGSGKVGPWSWDLNGNVLTDGNADTGWVNFTAGTGTGLFNASTGVTQARYRILNGWCTIQLQRSVITATNYAAVDYANSTVTTAVPTVACPTTTTVNGLGRLGDGPVMVVLNPAGTMTLVGGPINNYTTADGLIVQFVYPIG